MPACSVANPGMARWNLRYRNPLTREICWRNPPPSLRALGPLPSFVRFNFGNKPIPTRHQQANPHRHNNFSYTRMRKLWVRGAAGSGREIRNVTRVKDASPGVPCARSRRTWYASSQSEMKNVADRRKGRRRRRETRASEQA